MNKLFAIAFMCIYLLLSVGVVKSTHYCMGREKSTEFFTFQAKKCPCSAFLPENSGCCKVEHELLTVEESSFSPSLTPTSPDFFLIGHTFEQTEIRQITEQSVTQLFSVDFSPPPKEPIYQINCSLVLYDDGACA